jgi:hypothetical protein
MVGLRLLRSLVPPYSLTLTLFLKLTTKCPSANVCVSTEYAAAIVRECVRRCYVRLLTIL